MNLRLTRRRSSRHLAGLICGIVLLTGSAAGAGQNSALHSLSQPGHVLLLRHANAPGVGDPPGMKLDDCSTQRNLDSRGRAQARRLGERLRAAGITQAVVYTSQWCRCRETARLMNIGTVEDLPALNSFFNEPENEESRIEELRVFISQLPRDGPTVVLVTHQLTITALTGRFPSSGEGLILKLLPDGKFEQLAAFPAAE